MDVVTLSLSRGCCHALHPQKSSQHVRACVAGDGAICSKNRIIVPYHGDNPITRNGARLRSPSPIMAPVIIECLLIQQQSNFLNILFHLVGGLEFSESKALYLPVILGNNYRAENNV